MPSRDPAVFAKRTGIRRVALRVIPPACQIRTPLLVPEGEPHEGPKPLLPGPENPGFADLHPAEAPVLFSSEISPGLEFR